MVAKNAQVDEFTVVSDGEVTEETKIVFDTIGDTFTGIYLGMRTIENAEGAYQQVRFEKDGEIYFTNANYSLKSGLKDVRTGVVVRITYKNDLDTGQANPMRVFMIEVARKASPVTKASSENS